MAIRRFRRRKKDPQLTETTAPPAANPPSEPAPQDDADRPRSRTLALMGRIVREYQLRHWKKIVAGLLCMALVATCTFALPFLLRDVLDGALTGEPISLPGALEGMMTGLFAADPRLNNVIFVAVTVACLFIIKGSSAYGGETLMAMVGQRSVADIQTGMYANMMRSDLAHFHNTSTGSMISAFISDATKMRTLFADTITGIGRDLVTALGLIVAMFVLDWILSLLVFIVFPLAIWPIMVLGRKMRKVSGHTQQEMAHFTTLLDESFEGARHVKAYGMEDYETRRAGSLIDRIYRLNIRAVRTRAVAEPLLEVIAGIAIAGIILYAGIQIIDKVRTPGDFLAFVAALLFAYEPVRRLARLNANMQEGLAAADRVFHQLDRRPSIVDKPGAGVLKVTAGHIRFEAVTFSYTEGAAALAEITLDVPAGKTVALVGPSGAGKSTVQNLIPRFYDVDLGRVEVDGTDVRDVTIASLRANIGLVSQETSLFDDTILANIAYGRAGATDADIKAAAQAAAAHDFIEGLPEGYQTRVGGMGVKLSGGQRQRISIARAILKNAPILLLDEATSALDNESERQVQAALKKLMTGRTTLVIAHRLSTVADADLIYVLDQGRVAESGSHDDLLGQEGLYADLYRTHLSSTDAAAAE